MNKKVRFITSALALGLVTLASAREAAAQVAISANDGKATLVDGALSVVPSAAPDSITILDLGSSPAKVLGELKVPASVAGPPESVAIATDESFAIVTGAMRVDPADAKKMAPDVRISVIDLKTKPPSIIATVEGGKGPAGVSINRAGTLALVANRADGTVSVFSIANKKLTPVGAVKVGDEKSAPSHVAFTPDGKSALVTRDGDNKISVLSIDGTKVEPTKRDLVGGVRPYAIEMGPKGDVAFVGTQGGGTGDVDVINVIDMGGKVPRIVESVSFAATVEGLAISPDGKFLAATAMNNSNKAPSFPLYNDHSLLRIYAVNGTKITQVAESKIGRWCQGVVWSKDGKTVAAQSALDKEIHFFGFDGKALTKAPGMKFKGAPAGFRTAEK